MFRPALLVVAVVACSAEPRDERAGEGNAAAVAVPPSAGATAGAPSALRATCPSTGLWARCSVLERLERAGLAPRLDSASRPTEAALNADGFLIRVGSAELEVYIYPTIAARTRDLARVDTTRYLGYTEPVSMQQLPTLIQSANVVAVLHSRNDQQRERVGDALTAGPPQASTQPAPAPPSPTRTP